MSLKSLLATLVPLKYQVPVKFWFNYFGGELEPELNLLDLFVDKNDRVIDVGGNRGVYAYKLSRLGAKVEVFEPNPKCAEILNAWFASKQSVTIHQFALSNGSGVSTLHVPLDGVGVEHDASASLEDFNFHSAHDLKVQLRALDSFAFEGVRFIKIDVEGHELNVIEGAQDSIVRTKPTLLIEIEQRHISQPIENTFNKMRSFGYAGFYLQDEQLKSINQFDLTRDQDFEACGLDKTKLYINNFIFVHPLTVTLKFKSLLEDSGLSV